MRIHEFLFLFIKKQGTMSGTELDDLKLEAQGDYGKVLDTVWDPKQRKFKGDFAEMDEKTALKKMSFWQKVIYRSEQWQWRLILAALFPFVNAFLQDWLNRKEEEFDDYEEVEI